MAAQDGCAAKVHLPRLQDDGLVQRQAMKSIALPEEDAEQDGFPRNLHFPTPRFF